MITVVGEALIDFVGLSGGRTFTCHPGGSPANVAVGLARLGTDVVLATRLGDDALGHMLRDHLADSGVGLRLLPGDATATSLAIAILDSAGVAEYDFRIAWDVTVPPALEPRCRCLHTGSLATSLRPGAAAVVTLLEAEHERGEATISLDPNIRPALLPDPQQARQQVEHQVRLADVVKVSAEDLAWLHPGEDPFTVARHWVTAGPAIVVVTLGAEGAYAVTDSAEITRAAVPVDVVDTVGAGDAFTAGLLDWLRRGNLLGGTERGRLRALDRMDLEDMVDSAMRVAAVTCGRPGADPPTYDEVQAFAASNR